eukprot:1106184-Alexandrium_andersonii.AAC.1
MERYPVRGPRRFWLVVGLHEATMQDVPSLPALFRYGPPDRRSQLVLREPPPGRLAAHEQARRSVLE